MPGEISPTNLGAPPDLRASHADRDRVVDLLTVAAGDGRLTSAELDERVAAALSARTVAELSPLLADLPTDARAAADVVRIDQKFSAVKRVGRWVVPQRLELATEWCRVTLDFTEAVITHRTLQLDLAMPGKTLTLIVRPGIVVDTYGLRLEFAKVRDRQKPHPDAPTSLRVELTGTKSFGRVVIREARGLG